jgi:hypothetical protein
MSTEKEDQNWLDALGGKQGPGKSAEIIEAQALRSAILTRIQKEEQFEPSTAAYQKIIEEAKKRKLLKDSKRTWNWFGLTGGSGFSISGGGLVSPTYAIASIVLIVGLVAIVGYQSLELRKINSRTVPSEIFRGVGSQQETKKLEGEISSEVPLKSATPLTLVNLIINSALDSKLVAEVKQIDGGYQVIIYGTRSMNKDEVSLKAILGIPNQVEGDVRVVIKAE